MLNEKVAENFMENEKSNESTVTFGFVLAGVLVGITASVLMDVAAGTFGSIARVRNIPVVQHGLPVGIGFAVFLYLFFNKRVHAWADECVTEVRKVVWPTRKDVVAMTTVCCVMVLLAGVSLGIFDFFASQLIKVFVN